MNPDSETPFERGSPLSHLESSGSGGNYSVSPSLETFSEVSYSFRRAGPSSPKQG